MVIQNSELSRGGQPARDAGPDMIASAIAKLAEVLDALTQRVRALEAAED